MKISGGDKGISAYKTLIPYFDVCYPRSGHLRDFIIINQWIFFNALHFEGTGGKRDNYLKIF